MSESKKFYFEANDDFREKHWLSRDVDDIKQFITSNPNDDYKFASPTINECLCLLNVDDIDFLKDSNTVIVEVLANKYTKDEFGNYTVTDIQNVEVYMDELLIERFNMDVTTNGVLNTGIYNTGNYNSGDNNLGSMNTGNNNNGYANSGHNNIGNENTGNKNFGNKNSGSYNIGSNCIGMYNNVAQNVIGYCNNTEYVIGCFNTEPAPVYMFNKPVYIDLNNWEYSSAFVELKNILVSFADVKTDSMTNDEAFQIMYERRQSNWDKLSENKKQVIYNLPNFDKDIFKQTTGIDVDKNTGLNAIEF